MFHRLITLIIKELQSLLGSAQGRAILIIPVLLQTAIFPFAATLEVRHAALGIYSEDAGQSAQEVIHRLSHTSAFTQVIMIHSAAQMRKLVDEQEVLLVVHIPSDFSRKVLSGHTTKVQAIIDGRRSNSAQIAYAYASQVINSFSAERNPTSGLSITVQNLYNPNLDFKWHVLPSLVAIITTIGCLIVTALSVAREREEGTFDQLLVSPLTPAYIMAGKAIPGIVVAVLQGTIIALAARWIYGVPITGSLAALYTGMLCYGLALAGFGLLISSLCATQQQAFIGVFA